MQDWMFEVEAAPAVDAYTPFPQTHSPWEEPAAQLAVGPIWSQSLVASTSQRSENVAAGFRMVEPADDEFVFSPQQSESYALPDIVVTGSGWAPSGGGGGGGWGIGGSYDGDPELTNTPSPNDWQGDPYGWVYQLNDDEVIVIKWELGREPTAAEVATAELFVDRVRDADRFVKSLGDNERITLRNGQSVTGAQLKAVWARADFIIKPPEYNGYENGSGRGEANHNGGDPIITLNINVISDYNRTYEGGIFLPLHELGHLNFDGSNRDEVDANDLARAIANRFGVAEHVDPHVTYSPGGVRVFDQ